MLKNYLTITLRNLGKQRAYALINIAGLGVGMACCLLILLFVQDELRFDRFHERADHIYRVALDGRTQNGALETAQTAPAWGPMLVDEFPEVRAAVRFKPPNQKWLVQYEDKRFFEEGFVFADSTVFDVFSFPLVRGRPDEVLKAPFTVVLTESVARKFFGDADPIGQTLRLDNTYDFTVTGLMRDVPRQSHMPVTFLASMSTLRTPIYGDNFLQVNVGPILYTYLLLEPNADADALEAKLPGFVDRTIGDQLSQVGIEMEPFLQPLTRIHLYSNLENEIRPNGDIATVWAFSAIALFVLLIACINFMNLVTARSMGRAREVGMRKVLGAERGQLIGQFLGEAMVLALIALVLAVVLVMLALPFFGALSGKPLAVAPMDLLVYTPILIVLALVVGFVAGSYPAFFLSAMKPVEVLKGSLRTSRRGAGLRKGLVVFQFAISIFLIIGTLVVYNQLEFVRNKQLGFDKEHVVVMEMTDPTMRERYEAFRTRLRQVGGVEAVSAASSEPGGTLVFNQVVRPEGAAEEETTLALTYFVDFEFVETMGMEVASGRSFSRDRATDAAEAFVLNETAVRSFGWRSSEEAIGRMFEIVGARQGRVIGVVRDFHSKSLRQNIEPMVLTVVNEQAYNYVYARLSPGDIRGTVEQVERAWRDVYADYVFALSFLDDDFDRLYAADDRLRNLFAGFALLTVFVACLGLFGLASYMAEARTQEIGVRKVLGASEASIVGLLSKEFSLLVGVAFLLAAPLAYVAMEQWLSGYAYRIDVGLPTLLAAGIGALIIAWLTVSMQAIRAALANPVDSLRYE